MTTVKVANTRRAAKAVVSTATRRGQIAPMLAIIIFALFAITGIVLDGGRIQFEKRHMQLAADAAAMGGAHELVAGKTGNDIITAARDDAQLNKFTHYAAPDPQDPNPPPAPDMPINVEVNNGPLSGPHAGDANYVEVIITKDYATTFMRLIGVNDASVLARAVAGMENYGEGCVLALNPTESGAITVNGGAVLSAGCGVQVNSDDSTRAIRSTGGAIINALPAGIAVYGGASCGGCTPPPVTNVPPTKDWLGHVPAPTVPGAVATVYEVGGDPNGEPALGLKITGGTWNLQPGLYTGSTGNGNKKHGMDISGGTINLYPGIYFLDSGMKITSQTVFQSVGTNGLPGGPGEGVMFYNTTTAGNVASNNSWNEIDFTGGGQTTLKSMTTGPYKGILFFEDRRSPKLNPGHKIHGNVGASLEGFLYFSKGHLDYAGTTDTGGWTGIIADTINVAGNATLTSDFIGNSDGKTLLRTALLVE